MRILLVSAFYPPFVIGGWEQLVEEIAEHLASRGHAIRVLTSTYGAGRPCSRQDGIDRVLELESDLIRYSPFRSFLARKWRLRRNLARTREALLGFEPEVVFVHGMWSLCRAVPWLAEQLRPGRVVYYVADDWPYAPDVHSRYWNSPGQQWARSRLKSLLAPLAVQLLAREARAFPLRFEHVLCVSHAVRKDLALHAGIPPDRMRVVYNGIDLDRFGPLPTPCHAAPGHGLSLLYAGGLVGHKGVRTAIEALAIMAKKGSLRDMTLTVVGSGHPDYEASLHQLVEIEGLGEHVRFRDWIPREKMPDLLRAHDVFVFPSHQDALPRSVQEAMASGLVVVGTTTGGTKEILIEGETGLTFEPGDAAGLARQIERLAFDRELRATLRHKAQALVLRDFDIRRTVEESEEYLLSVAGLPAGTRCSLGESSGAASQDFPPGSGER